MESRIPNDVWESLNKPAEESQTIWDKLKGKDFQETMDNMEKMFIGTPEQIKEVIEMGAAFITDHVKDGDLDGICPQIIVQAKDMEGKEQMIVAVIASPFNESYEKHGTMEALGKKVYEQKLIPIVVGLISEAWKAPDSGVQPRHNPERQEIVMIAASNSKGVMQGKISEITRNENNGIILGEFKDNGTMRSPLLLSFFKGFLKSVTPLSE